MTDRREKKEDDLNRELRDHLDLETEKQKNTGLTEKEARYAARRRFGNETVVKEHTRETWGWNSLERFVQDLRYGLRMIRRNPGFAAVAVLTLALGIGANTAIFSIVNAVFLQPLPFPDANQVYLIGRTGNRIGGNSLSLPIYLAWQQNRRDSFDALALIRLSQNVTLTGKGEPERISSLGGTPELFSVFGVQPTMGRAFREEECRPGGARVAILSDDFWRTKFATDPNILGQAITINGVATTIIGVMPRGFILPLPTADHVQIWLPVQVPLSSDNPSNGGILCLGRLRPGSNPAVAEGALSPPFAGLHDKFPDMIMSGERAHLISIREFVVGGAGTAPLLLFGAVGFLLLIACANVANLLLARSSSRHREIAVRTALGAGRARLIRQLLTESVLLALAGGLAGLFVCFASFQLILSLVPPTLPHIGKIQLDGNVLGFAVLLSLLTGIIFGLAPALESSSVDLQLTLKEGTSGAGQSGRRGRLRSVLMISEVAVSLVLVVGAALTLESLFGLLRVHPGFETGNSLTFGFALPRIGFDSTAKRVAFYDNFAARVSAMPGVGRVAYASYLPFQGGPDTLYSVEGSSSLPNSESRDANFRIISPEFFHALNIPLIRGRMFSDSDSADSEPVAVINRVMANELGIKEDPLGMHIWVGKPMGPAQSEPSPRRIIGIVEDIRDESLSRPGEPTMYFPYRQSSGGDSPTYVVHTSNDPLLLVPEVRKTLRELAPDLPLSRMRTLEEVVSSSLVNLRFSTTLLTLFGSLALLIATVGVYGVISYSVSQRTHEIGIRVALGASRGQILNMVLGQGLRLAAIGSAVGLVASFWLTKLLSDQLYGVSATDPKTLIGVTMVLMAVALAACWIPARRAMRVDPLIALRYE
jgi:putative ABC transport system permease protein